MVATNNADAIGQPSIADAATATIADDAEVMASISVTVAVTVSSPLPDNAAETDTDGDGDGDGDGDIDPTETKIPAHVPVVYNPRKPKWWNRLGNNGRDATKSQKRAMRKVLDGAAAAVVGTTTTSADPSTETTPNSVATGLRLPPIPYGSKLDWDELFSSTNSSHDNNTNNNHHRDIWLELGFGRGENLQALLESRLSQEERRHGTETGDGSNENDDANQTTNGTKKSFYLVGAEVSGVGIGCLCKRIEQLQQQEQEQPKKNEPLDHYVLYRPEMDPYASSTSNQGRDTAAAAATSTTTNELLCGEQQQPNGCVATTNSGNNSNSHSHSLATVYGDRLRIHTGDGYKLLPKLPDGSLSAILVTFPDPFPKDNDANYRLVQHQTLIECHRILRKGIPSNDKNYDEPSTTNDNHHSDADTNTNTPPNNRDSNGRLFLATDHDGYHEWCHRIMDEVNHHQQHQDDDPSSSLSSSPQPLFQLVEPCPDRMEWLPAVSRYEQKGWDEGRSTKLSCWVAI